MPASELVGCCFIRVLETAEATDIVHDERLELGTS